MRARGPRVQVSVLSELQGWPAEPGAFTASLCCTSESSVFLYLSQMYPPLRDRLQKGHLLELCGVGCAVGMCKALGILDAIACVKGLLGNPGWRLCFSGFSEGIRLNVCAV